MDSLYVPEGDGFVSTPWTRGPWSLDHQHGGPPAALLARALERRAAAETDAPMHPARVTVEFLRPVPIAPLAIATETVRAGRKVRGVAATLAAEGVPVARAHALFVRRQSLPVSRVPPAERPPPPPAASAPYRFTFFQGEVGYHMAMEARLAAGRWGEGALTIWMRLAIPLVPGEATSPLQRVLVAADSGNGVSAAFDPARWSFVNPDLTAYLHRLPGGEWVCLDAVTTAQPDGVGLAECSLHDEDGPIGRSLQSLVVEPR